jgi:hypothetical protein
MCVGFVCEGERRISAREQVFPVITCVDERCTCLAREQTWMLLKKQGCTYVTTGTWDQALWSLRQLRNTFVHGGWRIRKR